MRRSLSRPRSPVGRDVAIKVSAEAFGERFEHEARVIASLNYANICTLHEAGPDYFLMELVEGVTLADRIKEGPISIEESLAIGLQISNDWSFFIKDDFKVNRRLTLNLGVRYDYNMSPYLRAGGIDGLTNRFIGDGAGLFGAGRSKTGNVLNHPWPADPIGLGTVGQPAGTVSNFSTTRHRSSNSPALHGGRPPRWVQSHTRNGLADAIDRNAVAQLRRRTVGFRNCFLACGSLREVNGCKDTYKDGEYESAFWIHGRTDKSGISVRKEKCSIRRR
jgi:hypothetical protein